MNKILVILIVLISLCVFSSAQSTETSTQSPEKTATKTKKPSFRANKDQVMQAQKFLRLPETGKLSKEDKVALKAYQKEHGLKASGSLNRATLEKMGITLTAKQQEIPVDPKSFVKVKSSDSSGEKTKKGPVFRATKDQVMQAQKVIKVPETGKLSKEDREALKNYQTANGIKATGTLNKVTLEKMGIALTDKQKEM